MGSEMCIRDRPVTASTSLFVVVDYSAICSGDPCLVGCPPYERRKLQVELRGIFSIFPDCPQIVKPLVYIPLEHNWQEHFLWSVSESLERLRPQVYLGPVKNQL